LRAIRESLPGELPLSGLSITAIGDRIVVREGQALRESDSGQYTLALDVIERGGDLLLIDPLDERRDTGRDGAATAIVERGNGGAAGAAHTVDAADAAFERALALEETDPKAAPAAYEACLERDADHLEARLNLGRLLHLEGRLREAEKVYRGVDLQDALLSFNLAVLLEDLEREPEAMSAYRSTLALDPGFADAHFNLARLYERAGKSKDALRHLLAYRRLMNAP
jgi:tetratricopeptide (TPR) repeat protein